MRTRLFVLAVVLLVAIYPAAQGQAFEVLFQNNAGRAPWYKPVLGRDGNFYGTTLQGGLHDHGTVFKMTPEGETSTLVSFYYNTTGSQPYGLVEGSDGNFYGTTRDGGANWNGTVFKVTPAGEITVLFSFGSFESFTPASGLVAASDGNFYGIAINPSPLKGNTAFVYKVTPSGIRTVMTWFDSTNGGSPLGGVVPLGGILEGNDGNFYGVTNTNETNGHGGIFKMTPQGTVTLLVALDGTNGSRPTQGLIQASDGNFYGTADKGGANGYGTIFKVTPAGELTTLHSFSSTDGGNPKEGVFEGSDGYLYGVNLGGANSSGTIFRITFSGEFTTLVTPHYLLGFNGFVEGRDENLYGVRALGGALNVGEAFKVTPGGTLTTLASFGYTAGHPPLEWYTVGRPSGEFIKRSDGNFYGTLSNGGTKNQGSIVKVEPSGALTTLFSFDGTENHRVIPAIFDYPNGRNPNGSLVEESNGQIFGTALAGGGSDLGTIFAMTPVGEFRTIVSFNGSNGSSPGPLVKRGDGNFYGVTSEGGGSNSGTIFKVTPAGVFTNLFTFNGTNGSYPNPNLVEGRDSSLYGTTSSQGNSHGTVFKVTPTGEFKTIVSFDYFTNGSQPSPYLLEGSDGNLYGTTAYGGSGRAGTVFKITPAGEFSTLASFDGTNGANPSKHLVEGSDGSLYGTTIGDEPDLDEVADKCTIFKISPAGQLITLYSSTHGEIPEQLVEGSDGNFYGTTSGGGARGYGTVCRVTPDGDFTILHSFDAVFAVSSVGPPVFGTDGKLYGKATPELLWRLSIPMAPRVTLASPSAISKSGASLSGTVNANGEDTTVTFEYGLTPAYGSSIVATPGTIAGRGATAVSAILSGLDLKTAYYYRLTASNANGSVSTAGASFDTSVVLRN